MAIHPDDVIQDEALVNRENPRGEEPSAPRIDCV